MQYIFVYIYLYISVYIYLSVYIYIYIFKKRTQRSEFFCVLLQKNKTFSHSFTFFAKDWNVLCFLLSSYQKNVAFFAFFYVVKKRTQKNASFFWVSWVAKNSEKDCKRTLRSLKERKRTMRSEPKRTQCPTLLICAHLTTTADKFSSKSPFHVIFLT